VALNAEQIRRYARHILLPQVGGVGQERLLAASVRVDDAGGAAGAALVYLAAAGVGTIVVCDRGQVEPADVWLYERADVGRPRLAAVRERVGALNPDVRVASDGEGRLLSVEPAADPIGQLELGARAAARLIEEIVA
jgi:molybdopterin-synthase adenylyltransferase